jgi:pimeloyl-ACP methyl ester carboxylesterase
VSAEPLPSPYTGLRGAFGRPTWREARAVREARALQRDPIWDGEGVPDGGGRRVVLVPGFMAGARSLSLLQPWLERCGWRTLRAPVGRNRAPGAVVTDIIERSLADVGGPVPVIAHSRGGQECRVVAVRRPELFTLLVTLGAPHRVLYPPHVTIRVPAGVLQLTGRFSATPPDPEGHRRYERDRVAPFPAAVPFVSVYSRSDGFLDWRACLDAGADNVEVDSSHFGLSGSVAAFRAVADALARLAD